jgi:hypothetical protein
MNKPRPWPVGVKLPVAQMAPHPSRPTAPEPEPKAVSMLRRTESRLWTPIFVVRDGDRHLVSMGCAASRRPPPRREAHPLPDWRVGQAR